MAEQIDLEKCNFRNFKSPMTLTLDRVIRHSVDLYLHTRFHWNRKKFLWTDEGTYGHTYDGHFRPPSNVIRSTRRSRPNKATSPPHMDGSVVFTRLRQCAVHPHLIHASMGSPEPQPSGIWIGAAVFEQLTAETPCTTLQRAAPSPSKLPIHRRSVPHLKEKGKEEYLYSAFLHQGTHKALRHGSHSFTCK